MVSMCINPDEVFSRENVGICSGTYVNLVKDIKRLIEDNELRESMGKSAKSYAMKTHSMSNANMIIDLIQK